MATCSQCHTEISCPGHQHGSPLDQPILPCAQICSIWVRAVDGQGDPVPDVHVAIEDAGRSDDTVVSGFAKLEDLPEGKHAVRISLGGDARARYVEPDPPLRKETLKKGDLKLLMVKLRPRVRPVMKLSGRAAVVGGTTLTLTLKTDIAYKGKGTLTCTAGAGLVELDPPLRDGKLELDDVTEAGKTVKVKATKPSDRLDDVTFAWALDPAWQRGGADVQAMTAVRASLEAHTEAAGPLADKTAGAGLLVHLKNDAKPRRRAKVVVKIEPRDWEGHVGLAFRKANVTLWDKDRDGTKIDVEAPLKVSRGDSNELFLEGTTASGDPGDTGVTLKVTDLSDVVDTFHATVVKAWLEVHKKSGPLPEDHKADPGLVLHAQNGAGERRRAKILLKIEPAALRGHVDLTATAPRLELWDKDRAGNKIKLSDPFAVAPDVGKELFLEGKAASDAVRDAEVTLKIGGLADTVDAFKVTVVETKLVSYWDRAGDRKADPLPVANDKKLVPGRTLTLQNGRIVQRSKLGLVKLPIAAPCKLSLAATKGGDKIKLFPDSETARGTKEFFENPREVEGAAIGFPVPLAVDAVKTPAGLVYWVEGAVATGDREVELRIDVDDVDDGCDAIAYTVASPKVTIEVARFDGAAIKGDIRVKVTAIGKTVPAATEMIAFGSLTKDVVVPAGHYVVTLEPTHVDEAPMRVSRLVPATTDSAVPLLAATTTVKLELAPPYKKVQFVGYWQTTGAYIGTDNPCTPDSTILDLHDRAEDFKTKWTANSMNDIKGRCITMKEAIAAAHLEAKVKKDLVTDRDILKVFMAPEFYFRGRQGVYPFEAATEILNVPELKTELVKAQYRDWLFVLGTALAGIESGGREAATFDGDITAVYLLTEIVVKFPMTSGAMNVASAGWQIAFETSPSWATFDRYNLGGAEKLYAPGPDCFFRLTVSEQAIYATTQRIALFDGINWHYNIQATDVRKTVYLKVKPKKTIPSLGWSIEQGTVTGVITTVEPASGAPGEYFLGVSVPVAFAPQVAAIKIKDPGGKRAEHNATVAGIIARTTVFVKCPSTSLAAAAAATWTLKIDTSNGAWTSATSLPLREVKDAGTSGTDKWLDVVVNGTPVFTKDQKLKLNNGSTVDQEVTRREPTKMARLIVTTNGARPYPGWAIEGTAAGAVVGVVLIGTNRYIVDVGTPVGATPATGAVKLVDPGETEIVNLALVHKGGGSVPVGADGRALKDLLVYKETISSVDFNTIDYGSSDLFYRDVRRLIELYGDKSRRALPTDGADETLGKAPNAPGQTTASGQRISEVSLTGIGGGTVFTLDGITFGLEVCLDHTAERLQKYYGDVGKAFPSKAAPGEPKVQVQLITSCGASIANPCTVPNGPIFNVDTAHVAAKINDGTLKDITLAAWPPLALTNVATYFDTAKTPYPAVGLLMVYEPVDIPPPGKV